MILLGYSEWRKFEGAIERAKKSCEQSQQNIAYHFVGADKMILLAPGTAKESVRKVKDYKLSRYACYLIAQNGDPRKREIARAQTYFALQTRTQELSENLTSDEMV